MNPFTSPKLQLRAVGFRTLIAVLAAVLATFVLLSTAAQATAEPDGPSADIINGTVVPNSPAEWPYMVAVLSGTDLFFDQYCGGTLISTTLVITAAHCVDGSYPSHVLVGQKDLEGSGGQLITVSQRVQHPDYLDGEYFADVALLKLASPASVGAPIPLANGLLDPPDGAAVEIAGWGNTCNDDDCWPADLYEASVNVMSNASCLGVYGSDIFPSNLCASFFAGFASRDTCQGDSGGPLVYNHPTDGPLLAGITSWGIGCAEPPYPGVYTRVSSYASWVSSEVGPAIVGESDHVDFGRTTVGGAAQTRTLTFHSDGMSAVNVGSVALTGSSEISMTRNTCTGTIPVGNSCDVDLQLSSGAPGSFKSKLVIQSNGIFSPTVVIPVFGTLDPPAPPPQEVKPATVSLAVKQAGRAKFTRGKKKLRLAVRAAFLFPTGVMPAFSCTGSMRFSLKAPRLKAVSRTLPVSWGPQSCEATMIANVPRKWKRKKVTATISFGGNTWVLPAASVSSFRLK